MKLKRVTYSSLNARQKEAYNFQKVAALLADYGFNCMRLGDDWHGADFLAYHRDFKNTLRVQLKARLTIDKKYMGKGLYLAFPVKKNWYVIEHDALVKLVGKATDWLKTRSWIKNGGYSSNAPSKSLIMVLEQARLKSS